MSSPPDHPPDVAGRAAICLGCRTALLPGETRCDLDHDDDEPIVSLMGADREALVTATWGPPEIREAQWRLALRAEQVVAGVGIAGFLIGLGVMWVVLPGVGPLHILGAGLSMALFWGGAGAALRRRRPEYPPLAAPLLPAARQLGPRGRVDGDAELVSPATAQGCVGYSIELRLAGQAGVAERVMFRDAVTSGFEVHLDGGGVARVPSGRLRLLGPMRQAIDFDNKELEAYLEAIDPQHSPELAFDPLRYDAVYEQLLMSGDSVELVDGFEPVVDPRSGPTHYREAPRSVLAPRKVPVLRLLSGG